MSVWLMYIFLSFFYMKEENIVKLEYQLICINPIRHSLIQNKKRKQISSSDDKLVDQCSTERRRRRQETDISFIFCLTFVPLSSVFFFLERKKKKRTEHTHTHSVISIYPLKLCNIRLIDFSCLPFGNGHLKFFLHLCHLYKIEQKKEKLTRCSVIKSKWYDSFLIQNMLLEKSK